jgi:transcriptional regulator GlxA family with amidase domain
MAKKETPPEAEVDEHGLVVHKYVSTVLVVVPPEGHSETTLRYARSSLFNVHVNTRIVSGQGDALLYGELQDEFQVDGPLEGESTTPYSGLILCGGGGAGWLSEQPDVLRLVREAAQEGKLIGAWGLAVGALAKAGILRKKRVTGDRSLREALAAAGARYTGTQVEVHDRLVTGLDDASGFRFGKALVQIVRI